MSNFPSEEVRIYPIMLGIATAGVGTADPGNMANAVRYSGQGNFSIVISARVGTASLSTGISASAVCGFDISVLECTAATVAAASVITGATMNIGASTAVQVHQGCLIGMARVASDLATTVNYVINGSSYHVSTAGATADPGPVALARMINGGGTGATSMPKVPHYTAVGNAGSSNALWVMPDDDQATGIRFGSTGTTGVELGVLQGVIDVAAWKLSTNTPKYIRVCATAVGAATAGQISAHMVSFPRGVGTPGKKVSCAT